MEMFWRFTERAEKALAYSQEAAIELGHNYEALSTFFWAL